MNLIIQILFYYIINISFLVKGECNKFLFNDDILCTDKENGYYNSMICECKSCDSIYINENICYSSDNRRSIYNPDQNIGYIDNCNGNPGKMTELDDQGNWLGQLMCARTSFKPDLTNEQIALAGDVGSNDKKFGFYYLNSPNKLDSSVSATPNSYEPIFTADESQENDLIRYYNISCTQGHSEKSCQYIINLCSLSIYGNNYFCNIANGVLLEKIRRISPLPSD